MQCVGQNLGLNTAVLLLHTWTWVRTGAIEPVPKIDGQPHSAITLKENTTHKFNCQSEGWDPQAPPLLTWYLNGERQSQPSDNGTGRLLVTSQEESKVLEGGSKHNSTFTLRARKWDRELVCASSNSQSGESYNATVILNVQFQPEIVRVNAHYSDTSDPGLSLVLFALVRSNPPATITWVDQSGRLVANTSDFLILDSRSYPWLTNHTLRVTLSSLSGNVSVNASNSVGTAQTNLTLAEFLQSSVEVPMLGILTGGAVGFITLLILTLLLLCLLHKNKGKDIEKPEVITIPRSESPRVQVDSVYLPRENMSLPSNLQLNDLSNLCKGRGEARQNPGPGKREGEDEEEDLSAAYAARGFTRFPMVGYIYKVNSMSSDEIWL
ncbi:transmembrane protein 25 [Megalops cyprinoides]|uniref:transmembrane protein 25 n=1 Tax=Megalops cyprinoides TaxID=118141 RepID=UPI0018643DAB|nr:transmembrane protein 25 [Megalops cyprinoides]